MTHLAFLQESPGLPLLLAAAGGDGVRVWDVLL